MKTLTTLLFFLFSTTLLPAQKVRLEGDNSRYLCLNDSLAKTFEETLQKRDIDSTISILYDYDNGRMPDSRRIVIWTHNGASQIRVIEGCSKIKKDITHTISLVDLWSYINTSHFDDVSVPIKSGTGQSHDRFYHITIKTPTKSFFVVVRDNERRPTERYKNPESDTRIMLTNKIDTLVK
jgi:predicted RND superfamily exporter protein